MVSVLRLAHRSRNLERLEEWMGTLMFGRAVVVVVVIGSHWSAVRRRELHGSGMLTRYVLTEITC